jgi:hypothetical protein
MCDLSRIGSFIRGRELKKAATYSLQLTIALEAGYESTLHS